MKNLRTRIMFAIAVGVTRVIYNSVCQDLFWQYSFYWIIDALLRVTFWCILFYPKYRWSLLNWSEKLIVVGVSIDFCIVFLPIDILLNPLVQSLRSFMNWGILAVIILQDRDGGGGGTPIDEKAIQEKIQLRTNNAIVLS